MSIIYLENSAICDTCRKQWSLIDENLNKLLVCPECKGSLVILSMVYDRLVRTTNRLDRLTKDFMIFKGSLKDDCYVQVGENGEPFYEEKLYFMRRSYNEQEK